MEDSMRTYRTSIIQRAKARGNREGFGDGGFYFAALVLALFLGVMTLSHWYHSRPADVPPVKVGVLYCKGE